MLQERNKSYINSTKQKQNIGCNKYSLSKFYKFIKIPTYKGGLYTYPKKLSN